ncbi:TIGR01777 family oxidoreductase [Fulvivirga kasyanovii]|uniref:TIGR01777 family protein n=1 Tax=Fulvivirga kasyanovii TaxID=396812 RepID=A0ABW9RKW3_9BACT|nr:TIGR01777 family oxidoreductase [Fulvivirga kasyanovii]MTI24580.1 TIGR01777 family protein [Fulvivirga kasyanovii]
MKKIVIAGGSGFLGTCLASFYSRKGYEISILSRRHTIDHGNIAYYKWDAKNPGLWTDALEGADAIINLNGKSVDCRYTEKNKQLIYDTRIDATLAIGNAIVHCKQPPKVWLNAASATIYRHSLDKDMTETDGETGTGFSVDVCKKWEAAFNHFNLPMTRKITLRTGIVLGRSGGPLLPLRNLAKMGMGGKQGSGKQYFSWLHENDFVHIVDFLINNRTSCGIYNVTSPSVITNAQLMRVLRDAVGMPLGIPLTKPVLELGAWLIGTETELILKSRKVIPERLLSEGYKFYFEHINAAIKDLMA